jgi:demethylmenaquinone methyltransferase/2-methoxy-6-polyprenyl-1,4-benzoquinol methylase
MRKGIQRIFSEVADTYELVNHVLTLGLDILWRKKAAREAVKAKGLLWMDVCSGTGEMAFNLSRLADKKVKIISVDFCHPMIAKAQEKRKIPNHSFVLAESDRLPFADMTFSLVTISFATRNIYPNKSVLVSHLKEFHRILKPGGYFVNLETSQPSIRIIQRLFHLYIKLTVKQLGFFLSGSRAGYRYLAYTIPRFFPPDEFSSILHKAGFARVTHRSLFLGVSAIHTAVK